MIRKRKPSKDDGMIYRLVVQELLPFTKKVFPNTQVNLKQIKERLSLGDTYVAVKGNSVPFGFVHVKKSEETLIVDMLAIHQRKQRHGWGKVLMQKAERYGKMKKCRRVTLLVDDNNEKAIGFYYRQGYQLDRVLPHIQCSTLTKTL